MRYLRQEAFCAPPILHYEMTRAVGDDIQHGNRIEGVWMNWAVADARPLLHYLQYLTFRDLGLRQRQLQAFHALGTNIVDGDDHYQVFHVETAVNLLAHCLEIEGQLDDALNLYLISQELSPRNNAANLHIRRLTNN